MAERAIDTATDVSRTITELSAALQAAIDRLSQAIATARQPGKPLATISAITREAPLASLFVAFLFGVVNGERGRVGTLGEQQPVEERGDLADLCIRASYFVQQARRT